VGETATEPPPGCSDSRLWRSHETRAYGPTSICLDGAAGTRGQQTAREDATTLKEDTPGRLAPNLSFDAVVMALLCRSVHSQRTVAPVDRRGRRANGESSATTNQHPLPVSRTFKCARSDLGSRRRWIAGFGFDASHEPGGQISMTTAPVTLTKVVEPRWMCHSEAAARACAVEPEWRFERRISHE